MKISSELRPIFVWIVCGAAVVCVALGLYVPPPAAKPLPVTKSILQECGAGLDQLELQTGQSISGLVGTRMGSVDINHFLAGKLISDNAAASSLRFSTNGPLLIVDGWGEPLHFAIRSRGQSNILRTVFWRTKELGIWSAGPNGVNDFGHGDDVVNVQFD